MVICLKRGVNDLHMIQLRGDSKGGVQKGATAPQSEVCPHCSPNEIFVECNWTRGMKI